CAHTDDDYVAAAVKLAGDRERRQALRLGLRDQVRRSPLGQAQRWVDAFVARAIESVEAK
ncbi:MAG: hypothetical protein JNK30_06400, partial [Phenylobacterium sp.]|uniref:hypothetical protein n=1 Tax=Phenylobacterium sp. TaxID=1871053 RepID=UPI001A4FF3A3